VPCVSVIVPCYNHARYVDEALGSLAAQTFTDWEALVIDDFSQDESLALAKRWGERDSRFRVLANEANLGTYATQAKALILSTGRLTAVLNSDDVWEPDKLRAQVQALDAHPGAKFCYTLGSTCDAEGRELGGDDVHGDWPIDPVQDLTPWLVRENRVLASSVLWRREWVDFHADLRFSGDWVALIEAGGPAVLLPERLTKWRIHGANTSTLSPDQALEEVRVRRAVKVALRNRTDLQASLARNDLDLVALYLLFGDRWSALKLSAGLVRSPLDKRTAWRRALSPLVPLSKSVPHLWPGVDPKPFRNARKRLWDLPPLSLRFKRQGQPSGCE
jgi:glycosyltransferase involved in cell wall biosynthesis